MEKIADIKDLHEGKGTVVILANGDEIALFNIKGRIFALNNFCPHQGGPLGEGEIEEETIICPWHGWQFNIKNGSCINMPGEDAQTIPIEIHEGSVYLKTS